MLAKQNRIRKKKEFAYIYKKNNCFYTKHLTLYVVTTKMPQSKVGFSVNNKVGNSVIRHKVKRRLSEIVRGILPTLPVRNYVYVAKVGVAELNFDNLQNEVLEVTNKFTKKV